MLPVLKHIPGHGRATADSHTALPVVDADRATLDATDFAAFRAARRPAAGDDRACCVHSHRPGRAGHPFGDYSAANVIRDFIGFDGLVDE